MNIVMKEYNLEHFKEKDIYSWEEVIGIIEDMESELYSLEEKIEDMENDLRDNYKRVSYAEQVGYNERDFY